VYTIFALYSPSFTLSPLLPPPLVPTLPRQDLFYPPVLRFCKRKKKDIFVCLRCPLLIFLYRFTVLYSILCPPVSEFC
jgi:hypothetical protein